MRNFGILTAKSLNITAKIVICLGLVFLFSCAVSKKIQAANILKKCKFTFQKAQLDSFTGDSLKFSVFLNAYNEGKDSLFVQDLNGIVYLDSLFEIPVGLQNSKWLSPGNSQVSFSGAVRLDLFKIWELPSIKKFRMQGKVFVALKPNQEPVIIDFDETRDVPPDLMEKAVKKAVKKLLNF